MKGMKEAVRFITEPSGEIKGYIPLPTNGYVTISLDDYISMTRAEQLLDSLKELIKNKEYDAAFMLINKENHNGCKKSSN